METTKQDLEKQHEIKSKQAHSLEKIDKATEALSEKEGLTMPAITEEDKEKAKAIAKKIDINDSNSITNYGVETQQNISDFSQKMIEEAGRQDALTVGNDLSDLMESLNKNDLDKINHKSNLFTRIFQMGKYKISQIKERYQNLGDRIDTITQNLRDSEQILINNNKSLSEFYNKNLEQYKELNVYIAGGIIKLDELNNKIIPEAQEKAEKSKDEMDYQRINDLATFANRLEKKIYNLQISRNLSIQDAPSIRTVQNRNQEIVEQIQSTTNISIPIWKSQVAKALTLLNQQAATKVEKLATDTTNNLLRHNADALHDSSIETAKENERGIVDVDTLKYTKDQLISTLKDLRAIEDEGAKNRVQALKEMDGINKDLKVNLLEYAHRNITERKDITNDSSTSVESK